METMKILALLMTLILLLVGCSPSQDSVLDYQSRSFSALLSWSVEDIRATALMNSTLTEDGKRDITLSFNEPPSLSGLTISQSGGDLSVSLGSLNIPVSYAKPLMAITAFFEINGKLKKSSVKEIDRQKFNCVEFLSDDGSLYTVYLDSKSTLPRRIFGKLGNENIILEILEFNIT